MGSYSNKQHIFLPLQPTLERSAEYYIEQKEDLLFPKISLLFYQFQLNKMGNEYFTALPDGCIDILFCCDSHNPIARIYGSVYQSKHIFVKPGIEYFGVRFPAGCNIVTREISVKEITDHDYVLTDIMKIGTQLQEKIAMATSFIERKQILIKALPAIIDVDHIFDAIVGDTLQNIYKGQYNLHDIGEQIGYSDRYIRRQFDEYIGISPKLFSKMVRFQKSLTMMRKSHSIDEIIFENGYYDQAHMIKEFKLFSHSTPKQFTKLFRECSENIASLER